MANGVFQFSDMWDGSDVRLTPEEVDAVNTVIQSKNVDAILNTITERFVTIDGGECRQARGQDPGTGEPHHHAERKPYT